MSESTKNVHAYMWELDSLFWSVLVFLFKYIETQSSVDLTKHHKSVLLYRLNTNEY